jgi:hypothetical protein
MNSGSEALANSNSIFLSRGAGRRAVTIGHRLRRERRRALTRVKI